MIDPTMPLASELLSPAGQRRRDEMLDLLKVGMRTTHRRRRAQKKVAASVALLVATIGLAMLTQQPQQAANDLPHQSIALAPNHSFASRSLIEIIHTDETIIERFRTTSIPRIDQLSDRALLATLEEIGRPTGLIRTDDHVWLTGDIVDPVSRDAGG